MANSRSQIANGPLPDAQLSRNGIDNLPSAICYLLLRTSFRRVRLMWQLIILSFLAGLFGGNAFPHFAKGIAKEPYPTVFGTSPVINFVAGWLGFLIAALFLFAAHVDLHPRYALFSGFAGLFLAGLFHAWHGSWGK